MRAAYKAVEPYIQSGYDIVFVARAPITESKEPEVERQLKKTLKSAGILTGSSNEK